MPRPASRLVLLPLLPFLSIGAAWADGGYLSCEGGDGRPVVYDRGACREGVDPFTPGDRADPAPVSDSASADGPSADGPGPWLLNQTMVTPEWNGPRAPGARRMALINQHRVRVGDVVDGGRVVAIARDHVLIRHDGGETRVPFGVPTRPDPGGAARESHK